MLRARYLAFFLAYYHTSDGPSWPQRPFDSGGNGNVFFLWILAENSEPSDDGYPHTLKRGEHIYVGLDWVGGHSSLNTVCYHCHLQEARECRIELGRVSNSPLSTAYLGRNYQKLWRESLDKIWGSNSQCSHRASNSYYSQNPEWKSPHSRASG